VTAGLPGTGIGGMFYLMSALATPLREAYLRVRGRRSRGWGLVATQTAIAGAILAGMWATGWLLGLALTASRSVIPALATAHPGNLLPAVALLFSVGTLAAVLLGVELLRLWIRRRPRRETSIDRYQGRRAVAAGERRRRIVLLVLGAVVTAHARPAAAQGGNLTTGHLGRADSAFTAGDTRAAAQEYAAVLAADPWNSHATYRLAQLHRHDPRVALQLFRRYVALEPSDPWGYMALAEMLARAGRCAATTMPCASRPTSAMPWWGARAPWRERAERGPPSQSTRDGSPPIPRTPRYDASWRRPGWRLPPPSCPW